MNARAEHTRLTPEDAMKEAKREGVVWRDPHGIPYDDGKPLAPTTYHQIGTVEAVPSPGRFANHEVPAVMPSAKYPEASGPWNDPVAASLNTAPDPLGFDISAQPVNGDTIEASFYLTNAQLEQIDLPAIEQAVKALAEEGKPLTTHNVLLALPKDIALKELRRTYAHNDLRQRQLVEGPEVERIEREQVRIPVMVISRSRRW